MKLRSFILPLLVCALAVAQETRSSIVGRITDQTGAAVPGATVKVTNTETNSTTTLQTNSTGYYEANLLMPGAYTVSAEATGFKQTVRDGITLQVASRIDINIQMQIGGVSESISVTAEAPLIDTSTVSTGRVMDNRTLMDLPVLGNSTMILVKLTPGIQAPGINNYLGLHSNQGGSEYSLNGNVGGNEWQVDGVPNNGNNRRAAYLPYSDTVGEFKVETSNFDASIGHSTGASIAMITKSGTNAVHGTLTEQHWQQRWNGTPFFVKQQYYRNIAAAEAAGNTARANELRNTDKQQPGRSNNWAVTAGGPVVLPKIFNGKDKLFFFFSYNGFKDVKTEDPSTINRTVPTMAERQGDFSQLLNVDPVRYQLYDPLTTRRDPNNAAVFIRDPFVGNQIPRARFQNPVYDAYVKLLPAPNNPQPANREQRNNYLAVATPYNWDYKAFSNRVDYNISDRHKVFGRWSWNDFIEDRGDWTYESARGLHTNGLNRHNIGATIDWVWSATPNTVFDFAIAGNEFREGDRITVPLSYKPSDVGFPKYMDEKAGDNHILPWMDFADNGYQDIGRSGVPVFTRYRMFSGKADMTHIRGKHSVRAGFGVREHFRTGGGGGNTSGNFNFTNSRTRRDSTSVTPAGEYGHQWAAFILGIPNSMSISTNDNYALHNPAYGFYLQDNYRWTNKLSVNFGLRLEFEDGITERYNRLIGSFDKTLSLPISQAAQAAYAANPIPEVPASQFKVAGGSTYVGSNGADRRVWGSQWLLMPRISAAYQLNEKTVIRGGYGIFHDTLNVLNYQDDGRPRQTNYSRGTGTIITTDFGNTWNVADPKNGRSPMSDPFPIRSDGTRFDIPTRDALGAMAVAGRGPVYEAFDIKRARQQRWRVGIQRQLGHSFVLDAAYAGSYSDNVYLNQNANPLPQQYFATGLVRNNANATRLNENVANPFLLSNFESLRTSNPAVYQDMATQGFFTGQFQPRNRILRPFPHLTGLTQNWTNLAEVKTHDLEITAEKRFSKGFNFTLGYTRWYGKEADWFANEFDATPTWRLSNDGRPHRFVGSAIVELPFGKGKALFQDGVMKHIAGGWQVGATYEWQPGPLLDFDNRFYYGDPNEVANIQSRSFDQWFNTAGVACAGTPGGSAGWERCSTRGPAGNHVRVFPSRIDGVRRDMTNQWNANLQKSIAFTERVALRLRLDALNVFNRSQMDQPNRDPFSTDFGRITGQTSATNRWIQIQARLQF
jgi:hypothetical protein